MTETAHPALQRLTAALERENAALAARDLAAIGELLAEKEAALANLPATAPPDAARALAALITRNRTLLEHAIAVQARVIALVARAAPPPPGASYRAPGGRAATGRTAPRTLCARV